MEVLVLCKVASQLAMPLIDVKKFEFMTNLQREFILNPEEELIKDLSARLQQSEEEKSKMAVEAEKDKRKAVERKITKSFEAEKQRLIMEIAQLKQTLNVK